MESGLSPDFFLFVESLEEESHIYLPTSKAEDLSSVVSMAMQEEINVHSQSLQDKTRLYGFSSTQPIEIKLQAMTYLEIQNLSLALKSLPDFKIENLIIRKYDYSLVEETWFLSSYVPCSHRSSLHNMVSALNQFSPGHKMPVESILIVLVKAIELASQIYSSIKVIGAIYMENIYFYKDKNDFQVLFEVFTVDFLQKRLKFEAVYPERLGFSFKAFFWSMGVLAYSCLTGLSLQNLPSFACMTHAEIEGLIDKLDFIPGLTNLMKSFFDGSIIDFDSIIKTSSFQTWSFILSCSSKGPEKMCPHAFYSLFYFNSKKVIYQNLPFLCTSEEFVEELNNEMYKKYSIQDKIIQHLTDFPDLNEGMLEFSLQFLIKIKKISPGSIRKSCLQLIYRIIKLKINLDDSNMRKLLIRTLVSLLTDGTLTVQLLFQNAGILYCLYENFPSDSVPLFPFISSLGTKSIEHIKFFRNSKKYQDPNDSISYLQQIPIHFKLQMTYDILQEMDDLMKTWAPALIFDNKKITSMCLAVTILYELLQAAKEAKIANQTGKCYKNLLSYKVSPVIVQCLSCNKQVCVSCAQHHIELTHKINFLTHSKIQNFTCQEETPTVYNVHASRSSLPACEEVCLDSFCSDGQVFIWKFKELVLPKLPGTGNLFYGEICFSKCESEDIQIILDGCKIEYDNNFPGIIKNNAFYCYGPRIGASDTFGIGITGDFKVFFTYNGFNLGRYVDFVAKSIVIQVKIVSFLPPIIRGNCPCLYNMQAYCFLEKEKLNDYKCIANIFVVLVLLRKKIMKKCSSSSSNLYAVVDDLKKILDFNTLKNKLKEDSGRQSLGQGCKPF